VHFLAQLMHEGRSHLQRHLTASVLGRKVFCMPFHRGTQVTSATLAAMKAALAYCQKVRGGSLLIASCMLSWGSCLALFSTTCGQGIAACLLCTSGGGGACM
jgi:hypothetical protein